MSAPGCSRTLCFRTLGVVVSLRFFPFTHDVDYLHTRLVGALLCGDRRL